MKKLPRVHMVGPLAVVAAVWNQAWSDARLKNKWSASAREFLLNEIALDNLASLGIEPQVVRMIVAGAVDEQAWVQRDVIRMYRGGVGFVDIINNVDGNGSYSQRYAQVRQVIKGLRKGER